MVIQTNKYGVVAQRAAELARNGWNPVDAWQSIAASIFPDSRTSQKKGCPKSAFLGLAEGGHIDGIPAGKYTTSTENKRYAIDALHHLQRDGTLASRPNDLWRQVVKGASIKHNGQMNVVLALWQVKDFICQK
jgi:hypothetical protein